MDVLICQFNCSVTYFDNCLFFVRISFIEFGCEWLTGQLPVTKCFSTKTYNTHSSRTLVLFKIAPYVNYTAIISEYSNDELFEY